MALYSSVVTTYPENKRNRNENVQIDEWYMLEESKKNIENIKGKLEVAPLENKMRIV